MKLPTDAKLLQWGLFRNVLEFEASMESWSQYTERFVQFLWQMKSQMKIGNVQFFLQLSDTALTCYSEICCVLWL